MTVTTKCLCYLSLTLLFLGFVQTVHARHKCPKLPTSKSLFATTTAVFAGTTVVTSRISNTSGCGASHESDMFYKPGRSQYLKDNWESFAENISQGSGPHLEVVAALSGCPRHAGHSLANALKPQYLQLFGPSEHSFDTQVQQAEQLIVQTFQTSPQLQDLCHHSTVDN